LSILVKTVVATLAGTALGLFATAQSVERGFGFDAVQAGPWTTWPKAGSNDADPYARAVISRTGQIPLGSAEGLSLIARADSAGRPLSPACDYVISGAIPPARFWTVTVTTPEGHVADNTSGRYGFTSSEIVRDWQGGFSIVVSRAARPGNWLPVAPDRPYLIVLRLYDTPNSATASTLDASEVPAIVAERCA